MLFISKDGGRYFVKTSRGFDDVELPLIGVAPDTLLDYFDDYNEVQVYLAEVYALGRQRAYGAIESLEVPKCLKIIAEVPAEVPGEKPHRKQDTGVHSSGTSHTAQTQQESASNTKASK